MDEIQNLKKILNVIQDKADWETLQQAFNSHLNSGRQHDRARSMGWKWGLGIESGLIGDNLGVSGENDGLYNKVGD